MHTHTHIYTWIHTNRHTHLHTHIHMCTYSHVHTYITNTQVHRRVYKKQHGASEGDVPRVQHTHADLFDIYVYTHTYVHTYTGVQSCIQEQHGASEGDFSRVKHTHADFFDIYVQHAHICTHIHRCTAACTRTARRFRGRFSKNTTYTRSFLWYPRLKSSQMVHLKKSRPDLCIPVCGHEFILTISARFWWRDFLSIWNWLRDMKYVCMKMVYVLRVCYVCLFLIHGLCLTYMCMCMLFFYTCTMKKLPEHMGLIKRHEVFVWPHVCMRACVRVRVCVCACMRVCVYSFMRVCLYRVCVCMCMYASVCTDVHHARTCEIITHTRMYTRKHTHK
jgi:hypothetical protein